MKRFYVYYNAHIYGDISDTPKSKKRIIRAETAEAAVEEMQALREAQYQEMELHGITSNGKPQFFGMIHGAEEIGE